MDDFQTEILRLKDQISEMGKRLADLERQHALPAPSIVTEAVISQSVDMTPAPMPEPAQTPIDLSGFLASRWVRTGLSGQQGSYQTHSASLFFGKKIGKWSFHSEMEYDYQPSLERGSIPVVPYRGEVELETAWVNYQASDWLNLRAGILMMPTYWRLHSYPSTTMTVQAPLLYENVFPPNLTGLMIQGSKYIGSGGVTYSIYAGQGREFLETHGNSRDAAGVHFMAHLPKGQWFKKFNTLDIGVHQYRDRIDEGRRSIWGLESRIERGRFGWLSEFARSRISSGGNGSLVEGSYFQPSVRITERLYGVYRYDRLNPGEGDPKIERHTLGTLYRPLPAVTLKLEWNRYPAQGALPARNGLAAGVSIFVSDGR